MYYNNKLGFYIRQYSTQIVVVLVSLIIIASGLFVYFKINNRSQQASTVVNNSVETSEETNTEANVTEDETILLSDELVALSAGQKASVKIATVDDKGVFIILSGDKRIKAKMAGVEFSNDIPDTQYQIDKDLAGKYVEIAFDEVKMKDGYAIIYIYSDSNTLYNAKLLKEGRLKLDSTFNKKSLEYNKLAESQAFAKQTEAGVWGK